MTIANEITRSPCYRFLRQAAQMICRYPDFGRFDRWDVLPATDDRTSTVYNDDQSVSVKVAVNCRSIGVLATFGVVDGMLAVSTPGGEDPAPRVLGSIEMEWRELPLAKRREVLRTLYNAFEDMKIMSGVEEKRPDGLRAAINRLLLG